MTEESPTAVASKDQDRFGFGANWQNFLRVLDTERIGEAERSLREMLGAADLRGRTFLDVGCGSGLFSLAAMRLGAKQVHSLDNDPDSVACAAELKQRFFPDRAEWTYERASVLDQAHLRQLGIWDVVYSWGVLHHTGEMWQALANVAPLVAPSGQLFVSIYNDQGAVSRLWTMVKRFYNRGPAGRFLVQGVFIPYFVLRGLAGDVLRARDPLRRYKEYRRERGMSLFHDWIDWLGGLPFEVASSDAVAVFFQRRGFVLTRLVSRADTHGCNEFVFRASSGAGRQS